MDSRVETSRKTEGQEKRLKVDMSERRGDLDREPRAKLLNVKKDNRIQTLI